jgi:MoaA/NifB/PqqE/SkfB family radical SAM enzyme
MDSPVTTPMSTLFSTQDIHIELSSKCTLKCPRCPRTELKPEQLNKEISYQEFSRSFTPEVLEGITKIVFCGDVGDPIYARDFLDIVGYIKHNSKTIVSIVTNASYKDIHWWNKLGSILTDTDIVTFSVDGWDQASNEQYRVNSNWDSIIAGAQALRSSSTCHMNWSMIFFNFNQDHEDRVIAVATGLGFDTFESVKSSKFDGRYLTDGVDLLKPRDHFVARTNQYEKDKYMMGKKIPINIRMRRHEQHDWAKCLRWDKELFINVEGLVFPCPWFNSGYQANDFVQKYQDRMSIKTRTLEEILNDPMWEEHVVRLQTMPLEVCKLKCQGCNE